MLWTTTIGLYLVLSCHTTLIIVAVGFSFKAIIMSALVSRKRPAEEDTPSSIITTFSNADGVRAGPPVQLDVSSSQKQLELLVNTILNNTDGAVPYAFYVNNEVEVVSTLAETIEEISKEKNFSYENILSITYQPLSVFKVRPVTRCVETMPGHTEAVLHVSYSPDGSRLASGGGDMAVRFWNVTSSMPMHTCTGHKNHVLCTAWSPDGTLFASADKSGEIRLWNPMSGTAVGTPLRGHRKWVTSLAFEPLHACSPVKPGKSTSASTQSVCPVMPFRLASGSKDHTIRIWNVSNGQCDTTISGHSDSVECVKWGGSGLIYTACRDRTIKVWNVDGHGRSAQKLVSTLTGHAHRVNSLALNCDYVLRTGSYELGDPIKSILTSSANASMTATEHYQQQCEAVTKARTRYQAMVGTGGEILASCSDDFTIFMWKPESGKQPLLRMTGHQQVINHIAFSPDGRFLASASFDKKIKIWCGRTGKFIHTLNGHVGAVYQVAWSADSQYIASGSKDSTVKVWSSKADVKHALHTLPGHADEIYAIDWSPNGSQVVSGGKDRTLKIWRH